MRLKPGDIVKHHPTGEEWIVAAVNYRTNEIIPSGWPLCIAKIIDCKIVDSCTDQQSMRIVKQWAESRHFDLRRVWNQIYIRDY